MASAPDLTKVGPTAFGMMALTWKPVPPSKEEAFSVLKAAIKNDLHYWNGGEFYGTEEWNSAALLREYLKKYPEDADKIIINIKGGSVKGGLMPQGTRENVRRSVIDSLEQLGGTHGIDVFECARQDPNVPVEETIGYLAELVKEGKIGGIALSEVRAETIRRAAKIHPIVSVEVELSLWATDIFHNGVASTCAELGIPITAYSPLARGALAKKMTFEDLPEGDFRRTLPKWQKGTIEKNNKLTDEVFKLAEKKGCTPAQIACSWVRTLSGRNGNPIIIPMPGGNTVERVEENAKHVTLTDEDMAEIDEILKKTQTIGGRYSDHEKAFVEG